MKKIHSGRDKKTNIENLKNIYIKTLQTQYKTIPGNSKQKETNMKMGWQEKEIKMKFEQKTRGNSFLFNARKGNQNKKIHTYIPDLDSYVRFLWTTGSLVFFVFLIFYKAMQSEIDTFVNPINWLFKFDYDDWVNRPKYNIKYDN